MEIKIVKEQRKSLMLKILSEDAILVKAPLRSADSAIQKFIDSKRGWIDRHLKKMKMLANFAKSFDFDNLIYENAIPIMETKSLRLDYERLSERTRLKTIKNQYLSMFSVLKERTLQLAEKFKFKVDKILPCSSTVKWGSYSSTGELKLNYKVVILPQNLVDYVIVHELCHIKHMNHKPQFWKAVEKFYPDYKKARNEMKLYSFVLKTKF